MPQQHLSASIGNDIIDLDYPEPSLHRRFVRRMFTPCEQALIEQKPAALWLAWAAKEAAYKALKRIRPSFRFVPQRLEFDYQQRQIIFDDGALPCCTIERPDVVAVWCATDHASLARSLHQVAACNLPGNKSAGSTPSLLVRQFAASGVAALLGLSPSSVRFSPPEPRKVPEVQLKDQFRHGQISFSHHGRYVAFSYLPDLVGRLQHSWP